LNQTGAKSRLHYVNRDSVWKTRWNWNRILSLLCLNFAISRSPILALWWYHYRAQHPNM